MNMIGVIGATGQVGKELVYLLKCKARKFSALVRNVERARSTLGNDTSLKYFDFQKPSTFTSALSDIRALFLVIDRGDNLELLIQQAKLQNIELIVFISGLGAERRPFATLGRAESLLKASRLKFYALRANWFMQNFTGIFLHQIRNGVLKLPTGAAKLSFVDARDIAEAAYRLFESSPKLHSFLEITGPRAYSHEEVTNIISKAIGRSVVFESISDADASNCYSWDAEILALFEDIRQGNTAFISKDLETVIGKLPRTLENFIFEHRNSWE
jgi:uncharacterized protein YbjT (DUF2867 family)